MDVFRDAREAAHVSRIPAATALPTHLPHRLARRVDDYLASITSGTLTVTVAPDETCGFNGDDGPELSCDIGTFCTWESGKINSFWCGWELFFTTCYDRTASCDSDCTSNSLIGKCLSISRPYCVDLELGDGIWYYKCGTEPSSQQSIESTQYSKPREFNTWVYVNGVRRAHWVSNLETSTTESPSTSTDSATSSPKHDPNIGAIVGGVVGGLAVIGLIILGVVGFMFLRRQKNKAANEHELNTGFAPQPYTPGQHDKAQWSPTRVGPYMDHPSPAYAPVMSPAPPEAPSPGTAWSTELDGRTTDHHRGTMQEMR